MSIVELMVASTISLVIVGAALAAIGVATRADTASAAQRDSLQEMRDAITSASTDIRQATGVSSGSTSSRLDLQTYIAGMPKRVIYEMTGSSFLRTVCSDAGFGFGSDCGGIRTELVRDIAGVEAFCYDPPACVASSPPPAMRLVQITIPGSATQESGGASGSTAVVQLRNQ